MAWGTTLELVNWEAVVRFMFFLAKTLDQRVARALAVSSELEVEVPFSLCMARLSALGSKGDQSLRSFLS